MDLGNLKKAPGSTRKNKRIGRGEGSGSGVTAGRGNKGQRSRSGSKRRDWFEGGQMPLQRRLPKFGFSNTNKIIFQIVNIKDLNRISDKTEINPEILKEAGLIKNAKKPVKILGDGTLSKKINLKVHAVSRNAKTQIEKSGGTVTLL
jgi:large subunit ribosomal protein L15